MKKYITVFIASLSLASCNNTVGEDGRTRLDPNPSYQSSEIKIVEFTNAAGDKFRLDYAYSPSDKTYGFDLYRLSGLPFAQGDADDILAQNTIRDYFNTNFCSSGYFAGINIYGMEQREAGPTYSGRLLCNVKKQENITQLN